MDGSARALALLIVAALAVPAAASVSFSFWQSDFTMLGQGGAVEWTMPHSDWGALDLVAEPLPGGSYLNLMVEGEWRIRNMPLPDHGAPGSPAELTFNFALGLPPGVRVESVGYGLSISTAPLEDAPAFSGIAAVGLRDIIMGGNFGTSAWHYVAAPPVLAGDVHTKGGLLKDFPNQQCSPMLCGPAAVSNGLQWLNTTYGLGMAADDISIAALQKGLKVVPPNGAFKSWATDKRLYIKDKKLPVRSALTKDFATAMKALEAGHAVELGFILGKAGHIASVVGLSELKNGRFRISVAHDLNQFNNAAGRKIEVGTYDPKTGLIEGITGMTTAKPGAIRFAIQSPILPRAVPEAATWAMMLAGFAGVGAMARRSRRRIIARPAAGQPFSFAAISATWRPWKRAPSSSFALGWRLPSPPASVVAP